MLSGRAAPDEGLVLVNGRDLHEDFSALKQDIAVVPQTEAIHDGLSVGAALRYTAELRLPPDTSSAETEQAVTDLLDVVGLSNRRETIIRHLSGGQLKRASLANELVSRPSLLYLDEVTSGLDEQTDREVMKVFRKVADAGKTVVCITHNLANVEATCHLVVILTEGGRLAFVGTPAEAFRYFKINRLGDVYEVLSSRKPDEWKAAFRANTLYNRYVQDRLPPKELTTRSNYSNDKDDLRHAGLIQQLGVLIRRYVSIFRSDVSALLAMLGQSLLVGILIAIVFGDLTSIENPSERVTKTINLLFLLNVSCFWLGCNNAAKELVKERVIFTRERDFNLRADAYLASKLTVLVCIGLVQISLLFGIVQLCCHPPGFIVGQWAVMAALAVAGTSLGLLISSLAGSEEVAIALVPIAIIPQIILAGVIASLSGLGKALAMVLVTCHWGERALEALLPQGDLELLKLPIRNYLPQFLVIVGHAMVFVAISLLALTRRTRAGTK
jgi:ABC-type multidrug transport system ATPase subunit